MRILGLKLNMRKDHNRLGGKRLQKACIGSKEMVALSKVQWDGYRRWMEKDEAERMAAREQTRNGRLRQDSRKAEGAGTKSRHEGSRGAGTPTHTLAKHLPALGPEKRRVCGLVFT